MKFLFTVLMLIGLVQLHAQVTVDFTDPATATRGTNAQVIVDVNGTEVAMMWAGDTNGDGFSRAKAKTISLFPLVSIPSDRDVILNEGLVGNVDGEEIGYYNWDVNLDGYVRAKAKTISLFPLVILPSDRDIILNTVLSGNVDGEEKVQF